MRVQLITNFCSVTLFISSSNAIGLGLADLYAKNREFSGDFLDRLSKRIENDITSERLLIPEPEVMNHGSDMKFRIEAFKPEIPGSDQYQASGRKSNKGEMQKDDAINAKIERAATHLDENTEGTYAPLHGRSEEMVSHEVPSSLNEIEAHQFENIPLSPRSEVPSKEFEDERLGGELQDHDISSYHLEGSSAAQDINEDKSDQGHLSLEEKSSKSKLDRGSVSSESSGGAQSKMDGNSELSSLKDYGQDTVNAALFFNRGRNLRKVGGTKKKTMGPRPVVPLKPVVRFSSEGNASYPLSLNPEVSFGLRMCTSIPKIFIAIIGILLTC
ncbi:uncharacterized protein PRCAT00005949001 [Priceomyces carsonii]|uniref:uncharacterized protein n=1 Tax=Priceomyces carsonii TaxID=28549 RepID=UPI002EDA9544|nr:unnamed protein product [Priceomyces carsonii]